MTPEELEQLFADRVLHATAIKQIDKIIKKEVLANGGISQRGLHAYMTQTINDFFPMPDAVVDLLPRFIEDHEWQEYCRKAFNAISNRSFSKFVRSLPVGEMVMDVLDSSGGLITLYGKPTFGVRTSAPKEGSTHVIQPGEKPLVGDYTPAQDEDDE